MRIITPEEVWITQLWGNVIHLGEVKLQIGLKPLRCNLTHSVYSDGMLPEMLPQ